MQLPEFVTDPTRKPSGVSASQPLVGTSPHNSPNCQSQVTQQPNNEKPEVTNPFELVTSGRFSS